MIHVCKVNGWTNLCRNTALTPYIFQITTRTSVWLGLVPSVNSGPLPSPNAEKIMGPCENRSCRIRFYTHTGNTDVIASHYLLTFPCSWYNTAASSISRTCFRL